MFADPAFNDTSDKLGRASDIDVAVFCAGQNKFVG